MKSVGEAMAIGRTFAERSRRRRARLETGRDGLWRASARLPRLASRDATRDDRRRRAERSAPLRREALRARHARRGRSRDARRDRPGVRSTQLTQDRRRRGAARRPAERRRADAASSCREAKRLGFSDAQLAELTATTEDDVRARRAEAGVTPVFAASTRAPPSSWRTTPYFYSTYESEDESAPTARRRRSSSSAAARTGSGRGSSSTTAASTPSQALRELGFETIMVNCNPETVSTDYDTSDRLYFEPLTLEDVLAICDEREAGGRHRAVRRPDAAQARRAARERAACRSSERAPTRSTAPKTAGASTSSSTKLGLRAPARRHRARRRGGVRVGRAASATRVLVRPSYVLGGRAMMIAYSRTSSSDITSREARATAGRRRSSSTSSSRTRSRSTSTALATASAPSSAA